MQYGRDLDGIITYREVRSEAHLDETQKGNIIFVCFYVFSRFMTRIEESRNHTNGDLIASLTRSTVKVRGNKTVKN